MGNSRFERYERRRTRVPRSTRLLREMPIRERESQAWRRCADRLGATARRSARWSR